jgi:predicted PurR-regulated permease PerM
LSKRVFSTVAVLVALTIITIYYIPIAVASGESDSIQTANNSINRAYANILAAEKSGANITQLITNLNVAAELLAQAENAYQSGNLNSVNSNADNARLIANQVNGEAVTIRNTTIGNSAGQFTLTIIISITAALLYLIALLLIWRRFKRRYNKRLLSMKPEVVKNQS